MYTCICTHVHILSRVPGFAAPPYAQGAGGEMGSILPMDNSIPVSGKENQPEQVCSQYCSGGMLHLLQCTPEWSICDREGTTINDCCLMHSSQQLPTKLNPSLICEAAELNRTSFPCWSAPPHLTLQGGARRTHVTFQLGGHPYSPGGGQAPQRFIYTCANVPAT